MRWISAACFSSVNRLAPRLPSRSPRDTLPALSLSSPAIRTDYGYRGGIRRSSPIANVVFTAMTLPVIGSVVVRTGTRGILRQVLEGGVYDARNLPPDLVDEAWLCGNLPGHPRAFLSLTRQWETWIEARAAYAAAELPITLVYGDHDWSRPDEREANARTCELPARSPSSAAAISRASISRSRWRAWFGTRPHV